MLSPCLRNATGLLKGMQNTFTWRSLLPTSSLRRKIMTSLPLWYALYTYGNVYNGKIIQERENGVYGGNFFYFLPQISIFFISVLELSIRKEGNRCQIWNTSKLKAGFYFEFNGWFWSITNYICCPKGLSHSSLQCSFLSLIPPNISNKLTLLIFHGKQKPLVKIPLMIPVNSYKTRHWLWITPFTPLCKLIPFWKRVVLIKSTPWAEQCCHFSKKVIFFLNNKLSN